MMLLVRNYSGASSHLSACGHAQAENPELLIADF
jgi:hypothetical protein